jgi:hypothetical protein
MISRIITNLAIYSWYDSYRTKERCDTRSNHLQLLYKLTEKMSMFFTDMFPTGVMYYMVTWMYDLGFQKYAPVLNMWYQKLNIAVYTCTSLNVNVTSEQLK